MGSSPDALIEVCATVRSGISFMIRLRTNAENGERHSEQEHTLEGVTERS